MKRIGSLIILFQALLIFCSSADEDDEEIFTDYCRPDLCSSGFGMHSGCLDGIRHNGKFQEPPCKPGTSELITLTHAEKNMIIDWHNYQRNYVACGGLMKYYNFKPACRMGAAKWDRELEATAYLHVSYCLMAHDKCRSTPKYPLSGQNLGWYSTNETGFNFTKAIHHHLISWYMEYQDVWEEILYNYTSESWHPPIGHFMISIHEKNVRLGCALAYVFELSDQSMSSIFTCNYAFTNVLYSPTYSYCTVPASKCETGTDHKYPYLCSTKEKYNWGEEVKLFPYRGDGTEAYDCGPSPDVVQNAPEYTIKERTTLMPSSTLEVPTLFTNIKQNLSEDAIKKTKTVKPSSTLDIPTKSPDLRQHSPEDIIKETKTLKPSSTLKIPTLITDIKQNLSEDVIKETTTLTPAKHSQITSKSNPYQPSQSKPRLGKPSSNIPRQKPPFGKNDRENYVEGIATLDPLSITDEPTQSHFKLDPSKPVPRQKPPFEPEKRANIDYEEYEMDLPISSSTQIWKQFFSQKMPKLAFLLLELKLIRIINY